MNLFQMTLAFCVLLPLQESKLQKKCCAEIEAARPGPAEGAFKITPHAESIRLPFDVHDGELRLVGTLNGKSVHMLIDNGSLWNELLIFGTPSMQDLGLEAEEEIELGGAGSGEPLMAGYATGVDVSFAGEDGRTISFSDQPAIIMPSEGAGALSWAGAEGQISAALFRNFVVGFDFDAGVITLDPPAAFDMKGKGVELHLKPNPGSGSWSIPGTVTLHDKRKLPLDLTIDLGWDNPLAINTGGGHKILLPDGLKKALLGHGVQGPIYGSYGTVPGLQVGGHQLSDVTATYTRKADGGPKCAEIMIGLGVFERFHVYFDYQGHRMFLEPNKRFTEAFVLPSNPQDSEEE